MSYVLEWVKSALLFGIFSSIILLLSPDKSYEKHINLVVGLLFILVMIHPVMKILDIDGETYVTYVQNLITASENGGDLSANERKLYGDSLALQLREYITASGFLINDIDIYVDSKGNVTEVIISFDDTKKSEQISINQLENYIKNVFGNDVRITYEY